MPEKDIARYKARKEQFEKGTNQFYVDVNGTTYDVEIDHDSFEPVSITIPYVYIHNPKDASKNPFNLNEILDFDIREEIIEYYRNNWEEMF